MATAEVHVELTVSTEGLTRAFETGLTEIVLLQARAFLRNEQVPAEIRQSVREMIGELVSVGWQTAVLAGYVPEPEDVSDGDGD